MSGGWRERRQAAAAPATALQRPVPLRRLPEATTEGQRHAGCCWGAAMRPGRPTCKCCDLLGGCGDFLGLHGNGRAMLVIKQREQAAARWLRAITSQRRPLTDMAAAYTSSATDPEKLAMRHWGLPACIQARPCRLRQAPRAPAHWDRAVQIHFLSLTAAGAAAPSLASPTIACARWRLPWHPHPSPPSGQAV